MLAVRTWLHIVSLQRLFTFPVQVGATLFRGRMEEGGREGRREGRREGTRAKPGNQLVAYKIITLQTKQCKQTALS